MIESLLNALIYILLPAQVYHSMVQWHKYVVNHVSADVYIGLS